MYVTQLEQHTWFNIFNSVNGKENNLRKKRRYALVVSTTMFYLSRMLWITSTCGHEHEVIVENNKASNIYIYIRNIYVSSD